MPATLIKCTIPVKNPRETGIKFFQPLFELKANEEEVEKKEEEEEKEEVVVSTYLLCAYQTPVLMVQSAPLSASLQRNWELEGTRVARAGGRLIKEAGCQPGEAQTPRGTRSHSSKRRG